MYKLEEKAKKKNMYKNNNNNNTHDRSTLITQEKYLELIFHVKNVFNEESTCVKDHRDDKKRS